MAVPILPLNEMSVEERLQTMEAIWQNLSANPEAIKSPAWHEEDLRLREANLAPLSSSIGNKPKLRYAPDFVSIQILQDCGSPLL